MALILDTIIDEVQRRADIAEVIGRYLPLKRAGRHFKALCPFHKERTPSFMVNTEKQIFHCFGCGVGGNVFSFLIRHDRLAFPEAVRQLAEQVGVVLPTSETETSNAQSYQRMASLLEKVCRYFERTLSHPEHGKSARAYLEQRGVSERTQKTFRLGLAQAGWDRLLTAASANGISPDALEEVGLLVRRPSALYDRFRHRLMFPILDVRGRVVGFGGRSLDGQEPKYLNSPESPLYSKGRTLFGMAQAKEAILERHTVVIVEGYFDCVVLWDAGITHVVSPLGTALTREQVHLLKRYAQHVILAFDSDAAGEAATLRGIDLLVEAGIHVQVASLPQGVDPDEYLRAYGRQYVERWLDQSTPLIEALMDSALQKYPGHRVEDTVNAAHDVLQTIAKIPDAMLRSEYVRVVASRFHIDEAAVLKELAKIQMGMQGMHLKDGTAAAPIVRSRALTAEGPERLLTAWILEDPSRWKQVSDHMTLTMITEPALRDVLSVACELATYGTVEPAQVISRLSSEKEAALVTELVAYAQANPVTRAVIEDCVRRLGIKARDRRLGELRGQIRSAQDSGQDAAARELLAEFQRQMKTTEQVSV